jgi:hypothetical protein
MIAPLRQSPANLLSLLSPVLVKCAFHLVCSVLSHSYPVVLTCLAIELSRHCQLHCIELNKLLQACMPLVSRTMAEREGSCSDVDNHFGVHQIRNLIWLRVVVCKDDARPHTACEQAYGGWRRKGPPTCCQICSRIFEQERVYSSALEQSSIACPMRFPDKIVTSADSWL